MARAAATISRGVVEWATDGLTGATRTAGGEMIFQVYALRESLPAEVDFDTVARAEGRRAMQEIHGENFFQHEKTANMLLDGVLEVINRVVAHERARAN